MLKKKMLTQRGIDRLDCYIKRHYREKPNEEPGRIEREHFEKMGYKWFQGRGWIARP